MDAKTNGKLKQLIEEVQQTENESKIAIPFVPYVGSDYWIARKKVLIVGKATDGWGWKDGSWNKEATLKDVDLSQTRWFENLEEIAHQFIEKKIIPFYSNKEGYSSLFWNRIYRILGKLLKEQPLHCYRRDPEIAKDVFRSFAWTNVFKVTHTRGNPRRS